MTIAAKIDTMTTSGPLCWLFSESGAGYKTFQTWFLLFVTCLFWSFLIWFLNLIGTRVDERVDQILLKVTIIIKRTILNFLVLKFKNRISFYSKMMHYSKQNNSNGFNFLKLKTKTNNCQTFLITLIAL